jgi:radical SAM superfamily enzyme YgiQ (UPF0313 family)
MSDTHNNNRVNRDSKILLVLLPYWTPQIPPMGIACIKSYLDQQGYANVSSVDANTEIELREGYDIYFSRLKDIVPREKHGNFRSIGNDVWQSHMMAHLNYEDEKDYIELVKLMVWEIFFHKIDDEIAYELCGMAETFYTRLEKYMTALLEREKPDVFGVSAFIGTLPASVFALKLAKEKYPGIMTVLGGGVFYDQLGFGSPNLDFFVEKTTAYIDKIIIGEGEILFTKLLNGEFPESQRVLTIKDLKGEVVNLDTVALPDVSDFDLEHYPTIGAYASRSCPFQCNFCSDPVLWGRYRKKSPKQVVEEFTRIYNQYGYQLFIMTDLLMNPMVTELSREFLKSDISFYWDCPLRICDEAGNVENTMLWRRAGYYRVEMGCESGSPRMLKLMNKKITVPQIRKALTALAEAGIKTTTYWVIGYPGETEEDFQMTLDLVEELADCIYEAMNNAFWYYPAGPVNNINWKDKSYSLFPEKARDMLLLQQWLLDLEPSREERYSRVHRFVKHEADERWKRLHKNAVPPLIDFNGGAVYIDENKRVQDIGFVQNQMTHDGNWGF